LTAEYTFPFYDFNNSSYSLAWSSSVYDARQDGSYIPTQPGKYTATIDLTTPTNYTAYENATIYFVNNTTAPSSSTKAMPTFYIDNLILESCTDGSGTYTSTPAYLGSFIGIRKWNTFIWTPFANDGNCFFSIEKSVAGTPDWQATTFTDIPATGDGFQSVDISSLGGGADVAQLRIKLKFVNCSGKPKVTSIGLTTCNPDITLEPIKDTTICEGNNIEIELHATGTELRYQWTKGGSDINGATTSILRINNITKKDEEVYSCRVSSGCTEKELEPFLLFVNQKAYINTLPLILLKNAGENLTFTLSPQGTPPFEYQWKKGNENIEGATNNKLTLNSVTCEDAAKYKCEINNLCGTSIAEAGTLIVRGCGEGTISGIVTYDNNSQTPIAGTKVYLETEEGYKIDSVITDDTGYYKFDYLANGNYRVESGVEKSWGGVDPVDALMVNRYFIGLYSFTSPMRARAADVSGDKKVNPLDALLINRRFVGLITHFNIPDWLTESYDITVSGDNITRDILTICAGDANGSYTPHKKVMHTIAGTRENEELQMEKGRIIDIPVYIEYNDIIGALGLKLKLRGREFEVIDVKSGIDGIIKNTYTTEGIEHVNVAWSAIEEGYRVTSGKAVIILKVRSKGEGKNKGEGWLEVSSESVIADYEGNIISTELLKVPKLIYGGNATGGGIHIYPNPFSGITNIEYRLEEEAEVKVNIYNLLGEKVMERGAGRQQEGLQRLVMDCTMLREGIYYCEMEITNREKQVTKKSVMVVSRGY
jgi:hypothetical protein